MIVRRALVLYGGVVAAGVVFLLGRAALRDVVLARWILPGCTYASEICYAEQEFRERFALVVPSLWFVVALALGGLWGRGLGTQALAIAVTLAAVTAALIDVGADVSSQPASAVGWVLMSVVPAFVGAVLGSSFIAREREPDQR